MPALSYNINNNKTHKKIQTVQEKNMKTIIGYSRGLILMLVCLMTAAFLNTVPVRASSGEEWVQDYYGLFSDEERQSLNNECQEFYEKNGLPVFILTADNSTVGGSSDSTTVAFIEDYADRNIEGDCAGLIINMETRYLYLDIKCDTEETRNRLTDQKQKRIEDAIYDHLSDSDWYGGARAFIRQTDTEYNLGNSDNSPVNRALVTGICAVLAALCTGIIYSFRVAAHHEKKIALSADPYVVGGTIRLTKKTDQFVRTYVTRVARPKDNDSGGHTSTHTSSGGHTHSGGGSHF